MGEPKLLLVREHLFKAAIVSFVLNNEPILPPTVNNMPLGSWFDACSTENLR